MPTGRMQLLKYSSTTYTKCVAEEKTNKQINIFLLLTMKFLEKQLIKLLARAESQQPCMLCNNTEWTLYLYEWCKYHALIETPNQILGVVSCASYLAILANFKEAAKPLAVCLPFSRLWKRLLGPKIKVLLLWKLS